MTAHDPRVTLTEAEVRRIVACLPRGSVVRHDLFDVVADLIAARLAPIRALADLLIEQGDEHVDGCEGQADCAACVHHDLLAALDAPVSASQDHDGAEGQGEECRPCCDAHPTQGCADVGCRHDCEGWIERFEERLR